MACHPAFGRLDKSLGKCIPCDDGFYGVDELSSCLICHFSCLKCDGPLQNNCTECNKGHDYLEIASGRCLECPIGFYGNQNL